MENQLFPIVAVGDVHGSLDVLKRGLRELGLIDDANSWTGGTRQLVQLGDIIDRGPSSLAALEFVKSLKEEAMAAGGNVHLLLGNHESMALMAGAGSSRLRMNWMYNGGDSVYMEWAGPEANRRNWPYPEEFYALFAPEGKYGAFFRTWRGALRIGNFIFTHASVPLDQQGDLEGFNAELARVLSDPSELVTRGNNLRQDSLLGSAGPLWLRQFDQEALAIQLERWGATTLVAGHSIKHGIQRSLGGTLLQIDIGMHFRGSWAAVGIDDAGAAWGLIEGEEPVSLTGTHDMLVRASTEFPALDQDPSYKFEPGDLVALYHARDGSYSRFFRVEGIEEHYGLPGYFGLFIERTGGETKTTPGRWTRQRIDRLGRLAAPGEGDAMLDVRDNL